MTAAQRQKLDFVSEARDATTKILEGYEKLISMQGEWNALDYGNAIVPNDLVGSEHEGLTAANVGAAVFDSANAITTLLGAGHATNLNRIRK